MRALQMRVLQRLSPRELVVHALRLASSQTEVLVSLGLEATSQLCVYAQSPIVDAPSASLMTDSVKGSVPVSPFV